MEKSYRVLTPQDLDEVGGFHQQFALDVLLGLSRLDKSLPSRYFYDDRGSELFQQITELDEYYPTASEFEIFRNEQERLCRMLREGPFNLVDLGSGDGRKTNVLLEAFQQADLDFHYIPIDISEAAVAGQLKALERSFPDLPVRGIVADYHNGLLWHSRRHERRNVVLFLGSNIGNFHRSEARAFLRTLWNSLADGDLVLAGFDLKKDIETMIRAYNDSKGITRAFNLNLLERINRELDADFNVDNFRHYATYDVFSGAMESYIVSLVHQRVTVRAVNQVFDFNPFEPIHTEYSYKFLESEIEQLAEDTGFVIDAQLFDSRRYFVDSLWRVSKPV